jgi:hypothetical protein
MRNDLMVGLRRRALAKRLHDEQGHMVAIGYVSVEIEAVETRTADELDITFLAQLTVQGLQDRLARLDPATREMPAADIAMLEQEDAAVRIKHQPPNPQRHTAREAPIQVKNAP